MRMWELLREYDFEDRIVRLYRSNVTLRKWKGETEYRAGAIMSKEFEDEKKAWEGFCNECEMAISSMEARHT